MALTHTNGGWGWGPGLGPGARRAQGVPGARAHCWEGGEAAKPQPVPDGRCSTRCCSLHRGGEELQELPASIPAAGTSPSAGTDTLTGCDTGPACRSGTTRAWSLPRAPGTALPLGSTAGAGGRGMPGHQGMSSGSQERSTKALQPRDDGRSRVKEPHAHPRASWCQPCRQPAEPGTFLCHKAQEQSQRAL